jgi:hypothetical protein
MKNTYQKKKCDMKLASSLGWFSLMTSTFSLDSIASSLSFAFLVIKTDDSIL